MHTPAQTRTQPWNLYNSVCTYVRVYLLEQACVCVCVLGQVCVGESAYREEESETVCIDMCLCLSTLVFVTLTTPSQTLVVTEDSEASLKAILTHSLLNTKEEIQEQLDTIPGKKGTKILIWNIRRSTSSFSDLDVKPLIVLKVQCVVFSGIYK